MVKMRMTDRNTANRLLTFDITDNMKNSGISELYLNKEFVIKFEEGRMCVSKFSRKSDSISSNMRRLTAKLEDMLENKYREAALQDIEKQLIEKYDEIFNHNINLHLALDSDFEKNRVEFHDRVSNLEKQNIDTKITFEEWQRAIQPTCQTVRQDRLRSTRSVICSS
jgi:uncharacterized protein YdiU (UPF0061 family)